VGNESELRDPLGADVSIYGGTFSAGRSRLKTPGGWRRDTFLGRC